MKFITSGTADWKDTEEQFNVIANRPDFEIKWIPQNDMQWKITLELQLFILYNNGGWNENIRRHNYVFNNGVGHFLQEAVRFQPYVFYSNLPLD